MFLFTFISGSEKGQSTVEAAFAIPLIFLLLLLLIQPGILLYNLMVMEAAASEACRLLVTRTGEVDLSTKDYEDYVKRRLGSIPPHEIFHVHKNDCSWEIVLSGDETSPSVNVEISHKVKPLPFLDSGASLLGISDSSGYLEQKVVCSMPTQPDWVVESEIGLDPKGWVEQW